MTFEDFKDELLTLLGGNLVDVELEDKDFQMAKKLAIRTFQQKGNNSYRHVFLPIQVNKSEVTYNLPIPTVDVGKIDTIVKIVKPSNIGFNAQNEFSLAAYNQLFGSQNFINGSCGCGFDYLSYELALQNTEMLRRYSAYDVEFVHDKFKNTITFLKKPEREVLWFLDCYVNLSDTEYMDVLWIQRWALAELKQILGIAYRKFPSLPSPTGEINLSGSEYIQEAKEEKEQLLLDIENGVDGETNYVEIRFG